MAAPEITWPSDPVTQLPELPWIPLGGANPQEQQAPAVDSVYNRQDPTPAPDQPSAPSKPTPEEVAEQRRKESAAKAAAEFRAKARQLTRTSRYAMGAVIAISAIITAFGSGNAHDLFSAHHTGEPWSWFPYPALEAGLIVEIQIGGFLGEHKKIVVFWGAALRFVTALAAITLCFYGPAEQNDWAGACIHAIGPFVQFFLAEYLAHARAQFRAAIDDLTALADGRTKAADADLLSRTSESAASAKERTKRRAEKRPAARKSGPSASSTADGRAVSSSANAGGSRPSALDPSVDDDLLVRARAAADQLLASNQRLNRDNLVQAIRAGGGTCPNKVAGTVLATVRAERGGPDLRPIAQQGA